MTPARARNLDLLRRLYEALESGDASRLAPLLTPAAVVRVSGVEELDGTYRGLGEIEQLYARMIAGLGPGFQVPAYEVLVHDASLVVVPRGSVFGDAGRGMDIYHFDNGLISEIWLTAWSV